MNENSYNLKLNIRGTGAIFGVTTYGCGRVCTPIASNHENNNNSRKEDTNVSSTIRVRVRVRVRVRIRAAIPNPLTILKTLTLSIVQFISLPLWT